MVTIFCEEAKELIQKWEALLLGLHEEAPLEVFDDIFRIAHNLKGSSRTVGLLSFGDLIHKVEDEITALKKGQLKVSKPIINAFLTIQAFVQFWIEELPKDPAFEPPNLHSALESFQRQIHTTATPLETPLTKQSIPKKHMEPSPPTEAVHPIKQTTKTRAIVKEETLRISSRKLDQILERVGELSIHQNVCWHQKDCIDPKHQLMLDSLYLSLKLSKELFESALSLRMFPIQPIFQRLERTARELSESLGKPCHVITTGGSVEIDKAVADRILEPLTHMVRNAIDHGLEIPEARGDKNPEGTIHLHAANENGSITLTLTDDGKGLDEVKILSKARSQGLISETAQPTKKEIFQFIFLPGFSTAAKVTDVSGRGVGMDVVRTSVQDLGGEIHIDSSPGAGSTFTIQLPASLSLVEALLIDIDGLTYALPTSSVESILTLEPGDKTATDPLGSFRGHIIPLKTLSHILDRQGGKQTTPGAILITPFGEGWVGLRVDSVLGQSQVVSRPLPESMLGVFGLAGSTILGSGEPGFILDVKSILGSFAPMKKGA